MKRIANPISALLMSVIATDLSNGKCPLNDTDGFQTTIFGASVMNDNGISTTVTTAN